MKSGYTDITVVLDRSGSMSTIRQDMEGGFNQTMEDQRKVPGECLVTLTQFDTEYECVYKAKPVADVPPLALIPRGGTALHDAVGKAIAQTGERLAAMPEHDRPEHVVFVIITDGEENSSKEFNAAAVKQSIERQSKEYNWKFQYLGANQDAFAVASQMGIAQDCAMNYASTPRGTKSAHKAASAGIARLRTGKPMAYTDQERQEASS